MNHAKSLLSIPSLSVFVTAINLAVLLPAAALYRIAFHGTADVLAWTIIALLATLVATPLAWGDGPGTRNLMSFIVGSACSYFPITVKLEDEDALRGEQSYVIGYEPHSALPVGIPSVFSTPSPYLPKFLARGNFHSLASGVCFLVPIVRQLWWVLGLRPATRDVINQILGSGGSVLLCPGGVQECLNMTHECELVYLRKRQGFIKMAIQHGSALVPVFAFGQGKAFTWYRPGPPFVSRTLLEWFSRRAGAVPIIMHGRWMTGVPHQHPISIVVGRPIPVPKMEEPSHEIVTQYSEKFIQAMEALFEKYKAECGCAGQTLRVM